MSGVATPRSGVDSSGEPRVNRRQLRLLAAEPGKLPVGVSVNLSFSYFRRPGFHSVASFDVSDTLGTSSELCQLSVVLIHGGSWRQLGRLRGRK